MTQLAIKGHAIRGKEIIEILEMLGGINQYAISNANQDILYTIRESDNYIIGVYPTDTFVFFTLEEFLEKFSYKVGDMARLSRSNIAVIIKSMKWENDEVVYQLSCDNGWWSVDNLKPYKEETMKGKLIGQNDVMCLNIDTSKMDKRQIIFSIDAPDKTELVLGDNFEVQAKDGKTFIVKKKPQYPKTYDECCKVLGISTTNGLLHDNNRVILAYLIRKIASLQELIICRDAYWKIEGDWKPEFRFGKKKYCVMTKDNKVISATVEETNRVLVFPTEEMRDAFYENFKELVEECKEFL